MVSLRGTGVYLQRSYDTEGEDKNKGDKFTCEGKVTREKRPMCIKPSFIRLTIVYLLGIFINHITVEKPW